MSRVKLILPILIAAILIGCSKSPRVIYTPPALEGDWLVRMTLSGGFAGLLRKIEVKSGGEYVVIDEKVKKTFSDDLTEAEISNLEELVSKLKFFAPEMPTGCADCFIYEIEIESGGRKMIASADDISLEDSGLGELVQFLHNIMDRALQ